MVLMKHVAKQHNKGLDKGVNGAKEKFIQDREDLKKDKRF